VYLERKGAVALYPYDLLSVINQADTWKITANGSDGSLNLSNLQFGWTGDVFGDTLADIRIHGAWVEFTRKGGVTQHYTGMIVAAGGPDTQTGTFQLAGIFTEIELPGAVFYWTTEPQFLSI
jgi:hypothetical protein